MHSETLMFPSVETLEHTSLYGFIVFLVLQSTHRCSNDFKATSLLTSFWYHKLHHFFDLSRFRQFQHRICQFSFGHWGGTGLLPWGVPQIPTNRDIQACLIPCPSSLQWHLPISLSVPLPNSSYLSLFSKALLSAGTCKLSNLLSIASAAKCIPSNANIPTKHIGCKQPGLGSGTGRYLQGGGCGLPGTSPIPFPLPLPCCEQPPALQRLNQPGPPALTSRVVKVNKVSENSPARDCSAHGATRTHI